MKSNSIYKRTKSLLKLLGLNKYFSYDESKHLIGLIDTSISSINTGDFIINEATQEHLDDLFQQSQVFTASSHDGLSYKSIGVLNASSHRIVCGTNLLSPNWLLCNQWKLSPFDIARLKKVILMGVGWKTYSDKTSYTSKLMYHALLSKDYIHSVRDGYTLQKMKQMGFDNVLNTGCPTMWDFTKEHCATVETKKSQDVVVALGCRPADVSNEKYLLSLLQKKYRKVYLWAQGTLDRKHFDYLNVEDDIIIVPAKLKYLDKLLQKDSIDYVGSRLHAGVRALQKSKRAIIISIDNRAIEMGKDCSMCVIASNEIQDKLEALIDSEINCEITIDEEAIQQWKSQFNAPAFVL